MNNLSPAVENTLQKPSPLKPVRDKIPQGLKERRQWLCWRYELRDGKWTKPPINAKNGGYAKSNDPSTWTDFGPAWKAYQNKGYAGLGFALCEGDGLVGLDLDHCLKQDGTLELWAQEVVDHLPAAYWEFSPSGEGLRGFCYGKALKSGKGGPNNWIEVYQAPSNRYLTVTGHPFMFANATANVGECQPGLDWLHERYFQPQNKPKEDPTRPIETQSFAVILDDQALLDKAMNADNGAKFAALWRGDISGNGNNPSSADLALCNLLAFWTGKDATQMDRLFRQSGLYREKWDKVHHSNGSTYGEWTIQKAIEECTEVYTLPTFAQLSPHLRPTFARNKI